MHEIVILVTAVLSADNIIWCIEEPEIHLHPHLQRQFTDFLLNETNNTYILSTHSPVLINSLNNNIQVFHVERKNGVSVGRPLFENAESVRAVRDLGLRASDLVQANSIIWVEGPSDQHYLRRWFELVCPDLVEGRDFVFMSYQSLRPLSIDSESISTELVNVLQINRNAIVILDSDKNSDGEALDNRKQVIKDACEAEGGISWVTDGREIENYIPTSVITSACNDLRGIEISPTVLPFDVFEDEVDKALKIAGALPLNYKNEKANYSRKFAEHFKHEDIDETLRSRILNIAERISEWGV